jgi:hypothetical protein
VLDGDAASAPLGSTVTIKLVNQPITRPEVECRSARCWTMAGNRRLGFGRRHFDCEIPPVSLATRDQRDGVVTGVERQEIGWFRSALTCCTDGTASGPVFSRSGSQ